MPDKLIGSLIYGEHDIPKKSRTWKEALKVPVSIGLVLIFIAANLTGGLLLDILAPGHLIWVIFSGNCALAAAALLLTRMPGDVAPASPTPQGHSHLRQPAFLAIATALFG